ncbi:MAG: 30S ribosomal protein S20, partial [Chlamydiota bacterium]
NKKGDEKSKKQRRPSALKRDLQGEERNLRNRSFKSKVGTAIRSLNESVSQKDKPAAKEKLNTVFSLMDKGVKKGVFKLNKAGRVKARLTAATQKA